MKKAVTGSKAKDADASVKCFMPAACYAFYLDWKRSLPSHITPLCFSSFMRCKPYFVVFDHKQDC